VSCTFGGKERAGKKGRKKEWEKRAGEKSGKIVREKRAGKKLRDKTAGIERMLVARLIAF
jgi:hypothetical protein